jgi:FkbM family methyltransferase
MIFFGRMKTVGEPDAAAQLVGWEAILGGGFIFTGLRRKLKRALRTVADPLLWTIPFGINWGRRWRVKSGLLRCMFGVYERYEPDLLRALVSEGAVVFDVGAHAGYYTLAASRWVGKTGRIVAFEPDPVNLCYLREHLAVNRIDNVTIVDRPVSGQHGEMCSFVQNIENSYESAIGSAGTPGSVPMKVVSLDRIIADGAPVPDIVKMDIEGGERDAMAGSLDLVGRKQTSWLISLHRPDVTLDVVEVLHNAGYAVYDAKDGRLVGDRGGMPCLALLALPPGKRYPNI